MVETKIGLCPFYFKHLKVEIGVYLGFLMLAFLLFIKGDEENNQYGNPPYSLLKTLNHANNTTKNDTPPHSNWMNPEEDK